MDISVDLGCHTSVLSYHLHLFIFETKVEWVGWILTYLLFTYFTKKMANILSPHCHRGHRGVWHAHWGRVNILPQINSPSQTPLLNCESPEHLRNKEYKDDQKLKVRKSFEWYQRTWGQVHTCHQFPRGPHRTRPPPWHTPAQVVRYTERDREAEGGTVQQPHTSFV